MRTTTLQRRASYAVLSAGLLAAALVPLTASASAAVCPTYVDDAEDAAPVDPALSVLLQDGQLDILSVTHSTSAGVLSSTLSLTALNDFGSDYSVGDWYEVTFTAAEKVVAIRVKRDATVEGTTTTRLTVDGTAVPEVLPGVVYDFDKKTVTLTVKQADLEKAVGAKLSGKPLSAMSTRALENYSAAGLTWDTATAPEGAVYVVGTACKAAAGAKPTPTTGATAAPAASATAAPSPSASASATPTGGASPTASATPSPTGPPPAPEPAVPVPAAGCVGYADEAGDSDAAVGPAGSGDDPDVDLVSVTGRTTSKVLAGHLGVSTLGSGPGTPVFTGHRFEYELTVGEKVVVLSADETGPGTGTVDGDTNETLVVDAVFDEPSSQVVLSVDRASLVKATGTALPDGYVLGRTAARSYALSPVGATQADEATAEGAGSSYVLGDDACFAPVLSVTAPAQVQTSDLAVVSVAMTTSDGRTAAGQTVTARVGSGRAVKAETDRQGTATLLVPVTVAAGTTDLVVRSAGSAGEGELLSPVRVLVERALLSARSSGTGASRTVTATLTDDDERRRALAGQQVVFAFGGRTVTVTTDRAGRASAAVPAGSAVDVSFAGRRGFLTAAKTRTAAR